mmetsp:Transcript_11023/g.30934  ORF Transcript_11023/g.30934 Transcript_11023/m.30934 type:complete len:258 (-) Transcript_11023:1254-2027(-)
MPHPRPRKMTISQVALDFPPNSSAAIRPCHGESVSVRRTRRPSSSKRAKRKSNEASSLTSLFAAEVSQGPIPSLAVEVGALRDPTNAEVAVIPGRGPFPVPSKGLCVRHRMESAAEVSPPLVPAHGQSRRSAVATLLPMSTSTLTADMPLPLQSCMMTALTTPTKVATAVSNHPPRVLPRPRSPRDCSPSYPARSPAIRRHLLAIHRPIFAMIPIPSLSSRRIQTPRQKLNGSRVSWKISRRPKRSVVVRLNSSRLP